MWVSITVDLFNPLALETPNPLQERKQSMDLRKEDGGQERVLESHSFK